MITRGDVVDKALSYNGYLNGAGYDVANEFSADLGRPTEAWCFGAGTLISTPNGLRPIEELHLGDFVSTPSGTNQRVSAVASRIAPTRRLRAMGIDATVVSDEHPYLTRAGWTPVADLAVGTRIALPTPSGGDADVDPAVAYLVGRWLGDGWMTMKASRGRPERSFPHYFLCCSHDEAEQLSKLIAAAGCLGYERRYPTVEQFRLLRGPVTAVLAGAGSGAAGKRVPGEVLTWNQAGRAALLRGYLDADGSTSPLEAVTARASTASRQLAYGIAEVARSLDHLVSIYRYDRSASTEWIEGRQVNVSARFELHLRREDRSHCHRDGALVWAPVREIADAGENVVYNLTVEGEHAFIADGAAVHNCADFATDIPKRCGLPLPSMQAWVHTGFSYVPAGVAAARSRAAFCHSWQALPGDLACFDWNGDSVADHTEVVTGYSAGRLWTIGGNSGPSNVDHFVGVGGVHRHVWDAPVSVGNPLILGIIQTGKFVTFGSAPAPTGCPYRLLMLKSPLMNGTDVKEVQSALNSHGQVPKLTVDGYYGPVTTAAVAAFQKRVGISVDGVVGCVTRSHLGLAS